MAKNKGHRKLWLASTVTEVRFPQNKKSKRKSTHIKEKSKKTRELVYLCDICHQSCQENPDQFEKKQHWMWQM